METFTWAFLADTPNLQMIAPNSEKFESVPLMKMDPVLEISRLTDPVSVLGDWKLCENEMTFRRVRVAIDP